MTDSRGALAPLIVNASAGRAGLSANLPFATAFEKWRELYANNAEVLLVEPPQIDTTLDRLLSEGHERIAIAGGDGTFSRVTAKLIDKGAAFVPLPLGTHNHFAKDLGIDPDPETWMRLCTSERVREVDVGSVNGRIFLNNVAMGWYPQMLKLRSTLNNERLLGSKRLASLYAALAMRLQRVRTLKGTWRVTSETSTRSGELGTKALLVSNNQYGSVPLDPSARQDLATGQLTLYMLNDLSVNAIIRMVDHGARGQLAECPDLDVIHGETVELGLSRAPRRVAVDGELVDAERRYVIESRHRCLRVVVLEATA